MTGQSKRPDCTFRLDSIAAKRHSLYAAEQPLEYQGANCMACSLKGSTLFQSVWHNVAGKIRMVSKRAKLNDPQAAAQIKNRSLADTLPDLKTASQRPENLISDIRHYYMVDEKMKDLRLLNNTSYLVTGLFD